MHRNWNHDIELVLYIEAEKPLQPCTGVYKTTTCAYKIEDVEERGISLLPKDFHAYLYWECYLDPPAPPLNHSILPATYYPRIIELIVLEGFL
jgi:hypothetical protein